MKKSKQQLIQWIILGLVIASAAGYFLFMRGWEISSFTKQSALHTQKGMLPIFAEQQTSGATVAIVPLKELPMLDIVLWFDAGSARDGEQWGISNLTARLIGEDTTLLNAQKIYDAFESVGAQFDATSSRDVFSIHLRTLTDNDALNKSVDMLETLLRETVFKPETVDREKSRLLAEITSKKDSAGITISDAFFMKAYEEHPYAHPLSGTAQTVSVLTADNLQHFYQQNIAQSRATIVIVGDISKGKGKKLATRLLAALPIGMPATSLEQPALPEQSSEDIAFPSTQTHLMFGLPALQKGNPDFYAMTLGNYILGGGFTSRLFQAVREKEGLAYNVSSQITTLRVAGPFVIYLQTRADQAQKALEIAHETLTDYMSSGPSDKELKAAKENIGGTFLLSLSSNAAIANHVAMLGFYGLPWDYADHFQKNMQAVKREDIVKVFQQYIQPNHFTQIVLGNDK